MELEREHERKTYFLCQLGFGILAGALIVACFTELVSLPRMLLGGGKFNWLFSTKIWQWLDTPVVFGCLIGWYLLFGRWRETSWQRRTGLLVVMGIIDACLWLAHHSDELGLQTGVIGHEWFRMNLGHALGWAEIVLVATIASDLLVHLGIEQASEAGKATRSLAASGLTLWVVFLCITTNWRAGGPPLGFGPLLLDLVRLLYMGSTLIWTVVLLQATALSIAATKRCAQTLKEMDEEDRQNDPLRSASDREYASHFGDRF